MTTITLGQQVQRKSSTVVWTIIAHNNMGFAPGKSAPGYKTEDLGIKGATEVCLNCIAKRNGSMNKWIDIENFKKNWVID